MKKLIIISILIAHTTIMAQIAIGKTSVDGDGILDFAVGTSTGVLLPIVQTLPTGTSATNGTLLMDSNDLKIKVRENNVWKELSDQGSLGSLTLNTTNDVGSGVIIGSSSSSANGILVLESTSKALILPKVSDPVANIKSPIAGTLCYDTVSKTLAVFDGLKWNFWK